MAVIAESVSARYSTVIESTLEALADGTDKIVWDAHFATEEIPCTAPGLYEDGEEDEDEAHVHVVPALTIIWSVVRAGGFYWHGTIVLPLSDTEVTNANVQQSLGQSWQAMVLAQHEDDLADLDAAMEEIEQEERG